MVKDHVVVIIPIFNAKSSIDLAIKSALNQKHVKISVIVVDHGSVDGSYEYIYKNYINIPNFHLIKIERKKNERRSASRPLNAGFQLALKIIDRFAGMRNWLMRLDSDDYLYSENVFVNMLEGISTNVKILNGKIIFCDFEKRVANTFAPNTHYNTVEKLLSGGVYALAHHATLISPDLVKYLFVQDGFCYLETIGYGEDLDFSIRLLQQCEEYEFLMGDQPIIVKKVNGDTISNSIRLINVLMDHIRIFRRHHTLSRKLLLNILIWFLLVYIGKIGKKVLVSRKPPAYAYAEILEVSVDELES